VTWGGLYKDCERGISRGCPLSPLLGAFFLHELDLAMEQSGLFYVRFMDDILVLSPTRWKLRRAVKRVNEHLAALDLEKHPDKTFIGRIEKGFDFLGYHFSRKALAVAEKTITNFVERLSRLYEQSHNAQNRALRLGNYVRRWMGWAQAGLGSMGSIIDRDSLLASRANRYATTRYGTCGEYLTNTPTMLRTTH
jgi:RNA-directed DNA polymerase